MQKISSKLVIAAIIAGSIFGAICASAQDAGKWQPNPKFIGEKKVDKEKIEYVQCYGTKKDGTRCKNKVKKDGVKEVYCRFHADQKNSE